ncbi:MAG: hypothetical protein ACRD0P_14175 [Stackebrandtia sp.]
MGAQFTLFYEFRPDSDDGPDDLAAYLGIDLYAGGRESSGPRIYKDPHDFGIVANDQLLETLSAMTEGLVWRPREKYPGLSRLADATALPDPVLVPGPYDLHPLVGESTGLGVRNFRDADADGRQLITRRSLKHLGRCGIGYSTAFGIAGRVHPRRPFPVYSGRVTAALEQAQVDMANYLPPEDFDIEPW